MKFDSDNGDTGLVRDALGHVIPYPVKGDTETGEVVCLVQEAGGLVRDAVGHFLRERRYYRAPLTVEPLRGFRQSTYRGAWAVPVYAEPVG
jgi:hypothetical protein